MPLTPEEAAKAVALVEDGRSLRYVAERLGAPLTCVHRAVHRYRESGLYKRRPGSGRKRKSRDRDDRFLVMNVLRKRNLTAVMARNRLQDVRGVNVSERTVRRRLKETNLNSYVPAKGPRLLAHHRVARLHFAREHAGWDLQDWKNVMFSDESRFCVRSPDGRERVWRRPGERYAECTFSPREPFNGGSVMVWAGISYEARTEPVVIENGSLNARRYITEVLEPHVMPFAPFVGDDIIFMQDNARPHIARCVREYLDETGTTTMEWPARSPDINPIEHVWDSLGRKLRDHVPAIENINDLRRVLIEQWDEISQDYVRHLFEGMPRRIEAVIRARGGNTRY